MAKLESLSPIFKVSNVATGGGERGQARVFFFSPTSVRKRPRRRATALQGRERADRGSLSTARSREIANRPTSSPVEPTLPKNLQSPKWKKKKKFPQYYPRSKALDESDISIASPGRGPSRTSSWLFFVENSTRANELGCQKTRLSETRLLVPRDMSRDQRASLGMRSRVWDPPRFRNSDTLKALPTLGTCAKFLPPPLPNFLPGHPSEALPERVRNRRFGRLWRTRVSCARRHLWNEDGPLGELGGARVSLHKLSREPLRVSHNVEFSPLPTPPECAPPELRLDSPPV